MSVHNVPGLPDVFTIKSIVTGSGTRYFPKSNGRCVFRSSGGASSVAWYRTFDEAQECLYELVGQMQ